MGTCEIKRFWGPRLPSREDYRRRRKFLAVLRVRVEAACQPTESLAKVMSAVRNLFPDLRFTEVGERVSGVTESLDHLRELIRNQRIRDAIRAQLLQARRGSRTHVYLSKQAAFVKRVNVAEPAPLGNILVEIDSDELMASIDFVAESTVGPMRQEVLPQRTHEKRPSS